MNPVKFSSTWGRIFSCLASKIDTEKVLYNELM